MTTDTTTTDRILAVLDSPTTARVLLHAIDWPIAFWLGSVAVHVVPRDHWLARHRHLFDVGEVVTVDERDEATLWRMISDRDRLLGAPPSRAIVVGSV